MDWREFSKRLLLNDGRISEFETHLIKRAMLADRVIDLEEVEFLIEVRRAAAMVHPDFDKFLLHILKQAILKDGIIREAEAEWLRRAIFSDQQVSRVEENFLKELQREAKATCPAFELLVKDATQLDAHEFTTR